MRSLMAAAAAVLVVLASSCHLNYGGAQIAQKIEEGVPDLILTDFQHTSVRHDRKTFEISAGKSELFSQKKIQTLDSVDFREYDSEGKVITQGHADHAVLHTDTNDVELTGNIQFYSKSESAHITCTYLYWHDSDRRLTSKPDAIVSVRKDNGSTISGTGFEVDVARRVVTFSGPVQGTVVASDETGNNQ